MKLVKEILISIGVGLTVIGTVALVNAENETAWTPGNLSLNQKDELRIKELERKVSGMQKQITILHSVARNHSTAIDSLTEAGTAHTKSIDCIIETLGMKGYHIYHLEGGKK